MSHVVSISTRLTDLAAIKATCAEISKAIGKAVTFKENQKTYSWYGYSAGDYPLPAGFTAKDLGKCDHAIAVEGAGYEVGLARAKDGNGWILLFDWWGPGNNLLDALCTAQEAQALRAHSTTKCTAGRFMQTYGIIKAENAARKLGFNTTRQTLKNGAVNVMVRGSF